MSLIKHHSPDGFYHIYNTGVDKREIFLDDQDYQTFLAQLKGYLSPLPVDQTGAAVDLRPFRLKQKQAKNLANEVKLYAYCLLPTRFHLLLRPIDPAAISKLLARVCTSYVIYFNKKYQRTGRLYEGMYKQNELRLPDQIASTIKSIHLAPIQIKKIGPFATTAGSATDYPYSSYRYYLEQQGTSWLTILPNIS